MKPKLKKWSIRLGILLVILVSIILIFHDNTDTEKIAKEQEESSQQAANEQLELLNSEGFDMEKDSVN